MASLKELRGEKVFATVTSILADAKSVDTAGNFGKVTTSDKEYFYILTDEDKISASPESYKVVQSVKHDALFIVPNTPNGFTKF